FVDLVGQATTMAARTPAKAGLRARLSVLEGIASTVSGDWTNGQAQVRQALAALGEQARADPIGRFGWNMVARGLALSEAWDDVGADGPDVRRSLALNPERQVAFEGTRALGLVLAGHPVDALRVAAGVRRTADVGNMTILRAEIALAEALARRELGDRER